MENRLPENAAQLRDRTMLAIGSRPAFGLRGDTAGFWWHGEAQSRDAGGFSGEESIEGRGAIPRLLHRRVSKTG
jgi:hypothetical protein